MDVMITIRASVIADCRWPLDTPEHRAAREAFMEGSRITAAAFRDLGIDSKRLDILGEIAKQSRTGVSIEYDTSHNRYRLMWHHRIGSYFEDLRDTVDNAAKFFSTAESKS